MASTRRVVPRLARAVINAQDPADQLKNPAEQIQLGPVAIDTANERLIRGDTEVSLRPKAFATLMYLAKNPGRIVTKDELLDAVWPDTVVGDAVLKVCIRELRLALQDDSKRPTFIETAHRRGYRFLVHAQSVEDRPNDRPRFTSATIQPSLAPVVGREMELQAIQACWDKACAGQRQVLLLSGEAGIGKTTLLEDYCSKQSGLKLVRGSCREQFGAGEAFLPFLEALEALLAADTEGAVVNHLRERAPTWYVQFPWLVQESDRQLLERELLGATSERMLREMAELLETLTDSFPLAVILEDLHWSDPSTLDLVGAIASRSRPARLLLVATYRPVNVILHNHPLGRAKRELKRCASTEEVHLGFLTEADLEQYVQQRLEIQQSIDGLAAWLFRRTEGSPLFLVQIFDYILERDWLKQTAGQWTFDIESADLARGVPGNLREMIDNDLSQCEDHERVLLEAASLAGFRFSSQAVAAAIGDELENVEACASDLARKGHFLRETGWIEFPDGSAGATYVFTHSLWQQALAEGVTPGRRTRLQRNLGERGEAAFGEHAIEIAGELALHFEEGRMPAKALAYRCLAADRAQDRYANQEAKAHLAKALTMVDSLPAEDRGAAQSEIKLQIGLLHRAIGDMQASSEVFERLATDAAATDDRALEAKVRLLCASSMSWVDKERCLEQVSRARALEPDLKDPALTSHVLASCAYWELLWNGEITGGAQLCLNAVEAAQESGDLSIATQHRVRLSFFEALAGRYSESVAIAREAHRNAQELGDPSERILADYYGSWALLMAAEWGQAKALIAEAYEWARNNDHGPMTLLFELQFARLELLTGDAASAEHRASESLRKGKGPSFGLRYATALLGAAKLERGMAAEAELHFREVDAKASASPNLLDWFVQLPNQLGLARCALSKGDTEGARGIGHKGREQAAAIGEPTFLAYYDLLLADVELAQDRPAAAREQLAGALRSAKGGACPVAAPRVLAKAAALDSGEL